MADPIVIEMQLLTPLWTGNAQRKGERILETGVLGSLRWWYEALIRGLRLYACDPSDSPCVYHDICHVCQLFGCTGFGRRFRLVVEGNGNAGVLRDIKSKESQKYFDSLNDQENKHRGWRIPSKVAGPLNLAFIPMRPAGLDSFERAAICQTLRLIERYGALGSKTSHGQGVINVNDWSILLGAMDANAWFETAKQRSSKTGTNPTPSPDLRDFIGVIISLDREVTTKTNWWNVIPLDGLNSFSLGTSPTWIPSAPAVRARLRTWLRSAGNIPSFSGNLRNERHRLTGTIQKPLGPKGSDVFVTHLYKSGERWSMRVFGFVPRNGNAVDHALRKLLEDKARIGFEVQSALGGISIHADPYPDNILSPLTENKEGQP